MYNKIQKPTWGTVSKYIHKGPILEFIAEFGYDLRFLLENAIQEEKDPGAARDSTLTDIFQVKNAATDYEDDEDDNEGEGKRMAED